MAEIIAALDIGTSKVCCVIGQVNKNKDIQIIGIGVSPCNGLKKGIIVDIDNTVQSIKNAVASAQHMANLKLSSVFVNIAGGHTSLVRNRGIIAVSREDREITLEDVDRVIQAAKVIAVSNDKEIIDVIPLQFIVDGYDEIKDPVGMIGVRLEVDANVVIGTSTSIHNIIRSVEKAGLKPEGIILDPIASSEAVLMPDEKELGVALLDIGAGVSDIAVFKDGNLIYSSLLPVGGDHITNDIAVGLKISFAEAENIKKQYGCAKVEMADEKIRFKITGIGSNKVKEINQKDLAEIIEPRLQELYILINKQLIQSGYYNEIPGGIIITGGGASLIKGSLELASEIFEVPVKVGMPNEIGVTSPIYSVAVGMIKYLNKRKRNTGLKKDKLDVLPDKGKLSKGLVERIKEMFSDFLQ